MKHSNFDKTLTLFLTFLKIGAFTFGGGYAMVALLESEFIYKKKWIEKDDFLNMIAIAESTPGPMAVNSATYIGYHVAGFYGATAATLAVCIPSFIVIYCISLFFNQFLSLHYITCAFKGIQVCVVYLILTAGIRMLKNFLNTSLKQHKIDYMQFDVYFYITISIIMHLSDNYFPIINYYGNIGTILSPSASSKPNNRFIF